MENVVNPTEVREGSWLENGCKSILLKVLPHLKVGFVELFDGKDCYRFGNANSNLKAQIRVKTPRFYKDMLLGGSIGAGESYIQGCWDSANVTQVIQVFALNLPLIDKIEKKFAWLSRIAFRIEHLSHRNSKTGSKKNILAHYDLGNEMYQSFLDPEMLYSSAIYPDASTSLEAGQQAKLQRICEKLALKPGMTLLEIGTGWGALAIYAAKNFGVHVTTTTISDAQHEYAMKRIEEEGLQNQVTLLDWDYRLLEGQYDRVVSIEMIEAVGHEYLKGFFAKLDQLLKPNGKMLIQAITIADQRYDSYRKSTDFIQKYIFPGGCLPCISVMSKHIAEQTSMMIESIDDIGLDYARTLNDWHHNFDQAKAQILQQGYGEDFIRMWKFYFSYCEGGFLARTTSTIHLVASKDQCRFSESH